MGREFICAWLSILLTSVRVGVRLPICDSLFWSLIKRWTLVSLTRGPRSWIWFLIFVRSGSKSLRWRLVQGLSCLARIGASTSGCGPIIAADTWSSWPSGPAPLRPLSSLLTLCLHLCQSVPITVQEVCLTWSNFDTSWFSLDIHLTTEIRDALVSATTSGWESVLTCTTIEPCIWGLLLSSCSSSQSIASSWWYSIRVANKIVSHMRWPISRWNANSTTSWSCRRLSLLIASGSLIWPGHFWPTSRSHVAWRRSIDSICNINPVLSCSTISTIWRVPWVLWASIGACSIISRTLVGSVTISVLSPGSRSSCSITSCCRSKTSSSL